MKVWYAEQIPCPACKELVTPEFSNGFWRIPTHFTGAKRKTKCRAINEKVIAA